jgi:hypothetical protein
VGFVTGKARKGRDAEKRPKEYDRFDELTRRLIRVPKPELDEQVKRDKERRSKGS